MFILFVSYYTIYIMLNRIKITANSLLNRRQGISPSVDRFLDDHGD
jgi:hypothetical protein